MSVNLRRYWPLDDIGPNPRIIMRLNWTNKLEQTIDWVGTLTYLSPKISCSQPQQVIYHEVLATISVQVERLPKTISQKILRNMIVAIVNNKPYKVSPTIEDPAVAGEIVDRVKTWREKSV